MQTETKVGIGLVIVIAIFVTATALTPVETRMNIGRALGPGLGNILWFGVGIVLYFLPSVVALKRQHRQMWPIVAVNALLGWTFIGWVVAFAWSLSAVDRSKIS